MLIDVFILKTKEQKWWKLATATKGGIFWICSYEIFELGPSHNMISWQFLRLSLDAYRCFFILKTKQQKWWKLANATKGGIFWICSDIIQKIPNNSVKGAHAKFSSQISWSGVKIQWNFRKVFEKIAFFLLPYLERSHRDRFGTALESEKFVDFDEIWPPKVEKWSTLAGSFSSVSTNFRIFSSIRPRFGRDLADLIEKKHF